MYINYKIIFTSGKTKPADARLSSFWVDSAKNYSEKLALFFRIDDCNIFILDNNRMPLSFDQCLEMSYAMLQGKHIIIFDTPQFADNVSLFIRQIILNRLSKILISDITMLDDADLHNYLTNLGNGSVNYVFTKHEATLVKSKIKQLFRNLVTSH